MDFRVRSSHQTAEPWMEKRIVTKTQKGHGVQVYNQSDADRFFLVSMELSTQKSCHKAKLLISTSTKTSCDVWCAQWRRKEENCGKRGHGCFILTMLQLIMPWNLGEFLAKNNITVLEQPPYFPDLAPWDFFLSPKLKEVIKGTPFQNSKAIKTAVTRELRAIPKKSFQECVEASVAEEIGKVHSSPRRLFLYYL